MIWSDSDNFTAPVLLVRPMFLSDHPQKWSGTFVHTILVGWRQTIKRPHWKPTWTLESMCKGYYRLTGVRLTISMCLWWCSVCFLCPASLPFSITDCCSVSECKQTWILWDFNNTSSPDDGLWASFISRWFLKNCKNHVD